MQKNPDMAKLIQLAQSPAGQQLISRLQQSGGQELKAAAEKASCGDYDQIQKTLSVLLKDPQLKQLVQQLGGKV